MKSFDELLALITLRGVHEVFGAYGAGFGIEQNAAELAEFLVVCQELGISSILEIGTGYKAGLACFLHDDLQWRVTSVDIQNYGHAYAGIDFVHPRDFDHDAVDEAFDLVLIDADHSYEGVKDDHEFYAKYADKVIAFHDIAGLRDCQGVAQYWEELAGKDDRRPLNHSGEGATWAAKPGYYEIIANSEQRGGIGYVVLSEVADAALRHQEVSSALKTAMANRDKKAYVEAQAAEKATPAKKPAPRKRTPAKKPPGVKK